MEKGIISVLYLDDEVQNLLAFKAAYRKAFNVHCVSNHDEALYLLRTHEIQVFLIDQRLNGIKGTEFLGQVTTEFPDLVNILVSGCFEDEAFLKEIASRGEIFKFIKKPWSDSEMAGAIEDAYKIYCFLSEKKRELDFAKLYLSNSVKAPIANLEGLISLARVEIDDAYALRDYLEYMSQSIEMLKHKLDTLYPVEVK